MAGRLVYNSEDRIRPFAGVSAFFRTGRRCHGSERSNAAIPAGNRNKKGVFYDTLELAQKMVKILDGKKATDIKLIDIRGLSTLGDYFLLASASNTTLTKSLSDELEERLSKEDGLEPKRIEGYQSASWILLDYYDVIVHIFYAETRQYYSLERLWADGKEVDLSGLLAKEE